MSDGKMTRSQKLRTLTSREHHVAGRVAKFRAANLPVPLDCVKELEALSWALLELRKLYGTQDGP